MDLNVAKLLSGNPMKNHIKHIDPERLFELAQLQTIVTEPEWPHIRDCQACVERYIDFVRQSVEGERVRTAGAGPSTDPM